MNAETLKTLLKEQLLVLDSAQQVLKESHLRAGSLLNKDPHSLSAAEKESCEALTARFARLCDFLFQRVFRTIDQIELVDEGTLIDRLNRMEKRQIISSGTLWRTLRELRNQIAHEYLIESSDVAVRDSFKHAGELFLTVANIKKYIDQKSYTS